MTALVFGEADPARYVVPDDECLSCRHPAEVHAVDPPGCRRCGCDAEPCDDCDGIWGECGCEEEE